MRAEERPTLKAPARKRRSSKVVWWGCDSAREGGEERELRFRVGVLCGRRRNSFVIAMPRAVARNSPTITLRGWARGEAMVLNWRMAAAPCGKKRQCLHSHVGFWGMGEVLTKEAIMRGGLSSLMLGIMKMDSMRMMLMKPPRQLQKERSTLPTSFWGEGRWPRK